MHTILPRAMPTVKRCAMLLCLSLPSVSAAAEVYKWVDANGRVHFSDRKHAAEQAQRVDAQPEAESAADNRLVLYPEADAMLRQSASSAQGSTPVLSAGNWSVGGSAAQTTSVLRFELSDLLSAVHGAPGKRLASAELLLFANTDNKIYGQGANNQQPAGHSTYKGDNAFYLKPSHNSWSEAEVTWSEYYSSSHYLPSAIRNLPSLTVAGSESADQNFTIDVRQLVEQLLKNNLREITIEMKLQRLPPMAQVTFHSREAEAHLRPRLVVQLLDAPAP